MSAETTTPETADILAAVQSIPKGRGHPVTPTEGLVISQMHANGASNRQIGRAIGRNHHAVAAALARHGLSTNCPKGGSEIDRFWTYVDKTEPCWIWTGGCNSDGYGNFKVHGKTVRASRYSYALANPGVQLTQRDLVCHHCDNPPCVNPAHLFLGAARDNTADMVQKGRARGISSDPRAHQLAGAAAKRTRTLGEVLPRVLEEMRRREGLGEPITYEACTDIPGYNALRRYYTPREMQEMARCVG